MRYVFLQKLIFENFPPAAPRVKIKTEVAKNKGQSKTKKANLKLRKTIVFGLIKECEPRFNYRKYNIYILLLKILKKITFFCGALGET